MLLALESGFGSFHVTFLDFGDGCSLSNCGWGVRLYHCSNILLKAIDVSSCKELLIHMGSIHRYFKFEGLELCCIICNTTGLL